MDEDIEKELQAEEDRRKKIREDIQACALVQDLVNFLFRMQELPGQTKVFQTKSFIMALNEADDFIKLTAGLKRTQGTLEGPAKAPADDFLKKFTRACGLRKRVAELTGLAEFYKPQDLDEE